MNKSNILALNSLFRALNWVLLPVFCMLIMFSSCSGPRKVVFDTSVPLKDIDGNEYGILKFGQRYWMRENLRVTRFRNGDIVPWVSEAKDWSELSKPARDFPEGKLDSMEFLGIYYNGYAATDSRGLCPTGWHISNSKDWEELLKVCGGKEIAAKNLKSDSGWVGNGNGLDKFYFRGLPNGAKTNSGNYFMQGIHARWWVAGNQSESKCQSVWFFFDSDKAYFYTISRKYGQAIRCVKNY